MKGRRHTPEQVVRKLHGADKLIGQGKDLAVNVEVYVGNRARVNI